MKRVWMTAALAASAMALGQTNWNFEQGLKGWKAEGDAFKNQPTLDDNTSARRPGIPVNHEGRAWIGSFENRSKDSVSLGTTQGDGPTGTLTSDRFKIEKPVIRFLIGGGGNPETVRVELLVAPDEGPIPKNVSVNSILNAANKKKPGPEACVAVRLACGANDDSMGYVEWDVAEFKGKEAFLRIVDAGSGEMDHINVDAFEMVETGAQPAEMTAAIPALSPEALVEHDRYMGMLTDDAKAKVIEAANELAAHVGAGLPADQVSPKAIELAKAKFPGVTDQEGIDAVAMLIMGEASKVSSGQLSTATQNVETATETRLSLKEALKRAAQNAAGQLVAGLLNNAANSIAGGGSIKNLQLPTLTDLKGAFYSSLSAQYPGVPNLAGLPGDWQTLTGEALRAVAPQLGSNAQALTMFIDYTLLRRQMGVSRSQALIAAAQPLIQGQIGKLDALIRNIK